MRNKSVLLIAPPTDFHAAAVAYGLDKNSISPVYAPFLGHNGDVRFSILDSQDSGALLRAEAEEHQIIAIWKRRPQNPTVSDCHPADKDFIEQELTYFQRNVFELASYTESEILWVNHPVASLHAETKLLQLKAARSAGFHTPPTLVSNNPSTVKDFVRTHGKVLAKTFHPFFWERKDKTMVGTSPSIIEDADLLSDDSVALCPTIYQKLIDKLCDMRVTIIGHHQFAVKLTAVNGDALLDWRPTVFTSRLRAQECSIPGAIQDKLAALMHELGLVFGCVDLVVDRSGEVYFLEINQGGQFLFVETLVPALPLLQAFSAMLSQARRAYSLDAAAELSLSEYESSDAYLAWRERWRSTGNAIPSALEA